VNNAICSSPLTKSSNERNEAGRGVQHRSKGRDGCRITARPPGGLGQVFRIEGKSAVYAYRDFGVANSTPPLVLLTRFRGTMDHWDPAFLDILASERRVILFDNAGVSHNTR
jgi:pimeloyl-ACP methyl ester carboxylesterase